MTQSTQKAHQLKNDFGELAEKVVDEIISSSPSLPVLGDKGVFGEDIELSTKWWKKVKNELKKIK